MKKSAAVTKTEKNESDSEMFMQLSFGSFLARHGSNVS